MFLLNYMRVLKCWVFSSQTETSQKAFCIYKGGASFLAVKHNMLKNIISRNFVYQSSKVRQLYTNLPKSNEGGKVFSSREKAAEGVWARQMVSCSVAASGRTEWLIWVHKNEQELEELRGRLLEQQKALQDTQNKLSELRDSLTSSKWDKHKHMTFMPISNEKRRSSDDSKLPKAIGENIYNKNLATAHFHLFSLSLLLFPFIIIPYSLSLPLDNGTEKTLLASDSSTRQALF